MTKEPEPFKTKDGIEVALPDAKQAATTVSLVQDAGFQTALREAREELKNAVLEASGQGRTRTFVYITDRRVEQVLEAAARAHGYNVTVTRQTVRGTPDSTRWMLALDWSHHLPKKGENGKQKGGRR